MLRIQHIERFRLEINNVQEIRNYACVGFVKAFAEPRRTRGLLGVPVASNAPEGVNKGHLWKPGAQLSKGGERALV